MATRGWGRGAELGGLLRAAAPFVALGLAGGALVFGMRNRTIQRAVMSPLGRDLGKRLLNWAGVAALPAIARLLGNADEGGQARAAAEHGAAPGDRDRGRINNPDPNLLERPPVVETESRAGVNVPVK